MGLVGGVDRPPVGLVEERQIHLVEPINQLTHATVDGRLVSLVEGRFGAPIDRLRELKVEVGQVALEGERRYVPALAPSRRVPFSGPFRPPLAYWRRGA